jgi:hypothetical protein
MRSWRRNIIKVELHAVVRFVTEPVVKDIDTKKKVTWENQEARIIRIGEIKSETSNPIVTISGDILNPFGR